MKTIGIIGTRKKNELVDFMNILEVFNEVYEDGDHIVSGGCSKGGDRFAEMIAKEKQIPIKIHYARWNKYGKSAGFIRNQDIADDADVLIACITADRTGGTEDTIKKFLKKEHVSLEDVWHVY